MGLSPFKRSCYTSNNTNIPNPDPKRWRLLKLKQFDKGYVLMVKYLDCTNYEGVKILVFEGKYKDIDYLDPHFAEEENSPIARFKPDSLGLERAINFVKTL